MNCNCSALIFLRSFLNQRLAGARPMVPRKQLRLPLLFYFQNVRYNFTIKTLQRAHNSSAKAFFCVKATSIFQGNLYIIQSKHYKELLIFGQGLLLCQSHMICINNIKSRYAQIALRANLVTRYSRYDTNHVTRTHCRRYSGEIRACHPAWAPKYLLDIVTSKVKIYHIFKHIQRED